MPPPSRRTQQERRERTETALVAAAAELVVEAGVRALTLARVGERAGYSRGMVTHHFGSKQGLVDALARATRSGFVPGLDGVGPGLDRLLALVEGYVDALADPGTRGRAFLLLWAGSATEPELAADFRTRDVDFRADIAADVAAGVDAGTVRADTDPAAVAVAVVGQLRGIGLQRLLDPDAVDTAGLGASTAAQWRRALTSDPGVS